MPTYVLSKVKRTGTGQKVGDLADQDFPTPELTELADDDKILAGDTSASGVLSWFAPTRILTYILAKLESITVTVKIGGSGNKSSLIVRGHGATDQPVVSIETNDDGSQKSFQAKRASQSQGWVSCDGALGGSEEQPGIAFGPGSGARDTALYREGADHLKTPDKLTVGELDVVAAGKAKSLRALGLGTASTKDVGKNEGHVVVLGRYGYMPFGVLGLGGLAQWERWEGSQDSYDRLGPNWESDRLYFIKS